MAKQSLREFQAQLNERLKGATRGQLASKLCLAAGGRSWMVDLTEINEFVTVDALLPVPWTQPWFLGLANIRGLIYGCTDLAAFAGGTAAATYAGVNLITVNPRLGINAALVIDRTLGLRNPVQFTPAGAPESAPHPWIQQQWRDADGQTYLEISLEKLVQTPGFLDVALYHARLS